MSSDTEVGQLFWAATHSDTTPAPASAPPVSSCCDPKAESKLGETDPAVVTSSCCGPNLAVDATTAPTAKKNSCCG